MLLAMAALSFSSCNSLESKARKQLKVTLIDVLNNPDAFKVKNEKIIISNDSLFLMTFVGFGESSSGRHLSQRAEYAFIRHKDTDGTIKYMEYIGAADDTHSIYKYNRRLKNKTYDNLEKRMLEIDMKTRKSSLEDAIIHMTYSYTVMKSLFNGREVEYN